MVPIGSSSGLPEGCALSVVGMTVINWLLDVYQSRYSPDCRAFSFVDNLEVVSPDLGHLLQGHAVLTRYMSLWHLQLDQPKTYFWSTSASERELPRRLGLSVLLQANSLGWCYDLLSPTSSGYTT